MDERRARGALIRHELGREADRAPRLPERDDPVLERLAHHLVHLVAELRQLVKEGEGL